MPRSIAALLCGALALLAAAGCDETAGAPQPDPAAALADVVAVTVDGDPAAYRFAITLESPDTGCERYADWWEVLSPDGALIYRRVLAHSHVDEQPFTRSGGPVAIGPEDEVIVRGHMSPGGYGGRVMRGSVAAGFVAVMPADGFAADLADAAPLPDGCAF